MSYTKTPLQTMKGEGKESAKSKMRELGKKSDIPFNFYNIVYTFIGKKNKMFRLREILI